MIAHLRAHLLRHRQFPGDRRQRRVLEAVQRDHRVRQRRHQRLGGLDLSRRLALGGSDAGEKLLVSLDLAGEALFRFMVTACLVLGRLGAALDLGELAAATGDRFFRERFCLGTRRLFGFRGLVLRLLDLGDGDLLTGGGHARWRLTACLGKKSRCVRVHVCLQQIDSHQVNCGHDWRK